MAALQRAFLTHFDWSALPPPPEGGPLWPSVSAFYADTFSNRTFQLLLAIGFVFFLLVQRWGCHLHTHHVRPAERAKIQRAQFAGNLMSLVHSLMISGCGLWLAASLTPAQAYFAPSEAWEWPLSLAVYKVASVLSLAYFLLDAACIGCFYA